MVILELRQSIREMLKDIENYKEEADIIISHFTGLTKTQILLNAHIDDKKARECNRAAKRRKRGEPLQYIIKTWNFYGLDFKVDKGVLIPRQETEILVDTVLNDLSLKKEKNMKIADLCSGTGCIGISLSDNLKHAQVTCFENSKEALKCLRYNKEKLDAKVEIYEKDVLSKQSIEKIEKFDIITCNPPYLNKQDMRNLQKEVKFEPLMALYGGDDGLRYYRKIIPLWENKLNKNGRIYFEIGDGQAKEVAKILKENNMVEIKSFKDYNNIQRVVSAIKG